MRINTFLRPGLLLHVVIWSVLFLSPLMFIGNNEKISIVRFMTNSVVQLTFFIVFYMNYLFLAPECLLRGKKRFFWLVNILMIVCLALALHGWFEYNLDKEIKSGTVKKRKDSGRKEDMRILFVFRDIFNLTVAATTATAIVVVGKLKESEEARKEAEAASVEAELKNLRNQINPHFLLNTLNNIYALTAFDGDKARKAILELSDMLRHILYDNQQAYVCLNDEIKFIHNYIDLMKIRLTDNVKVTEDISVPEQCGIYIAPLIFISLIENAFKHGVALSSRSFIHIMISADDEKVTCRIENSNHPKAQTDRSGHGIGLRQVRKRLELAYKGRFDWKKGITENNTYLSEIKIYYDTELRDNRR